MVCGAALAGLWAVDAGAQSVDLKIHNFLGPKSTQQAKLLAPWARAVTKDSKGRIKARVYPNMQLGGRPPQLYDQIKDGVVEAGWTLPGYSGGRFPLTSVFELPFMVTTAEATTQAFQEFGEKYLQNTEFKDTHILLFHTAARFLFHNKSGPISSAASLKGLKIRATNREMGAVLSALGATPVFMPIPAVPQALSKGVVEGAVLPWEVAVPIKVHELVTYHSEIRGQNGFIAAAFIFAMNSKFYNGLPADLKKVVDSNSGKAFAKRIGIVYDGVEVTNREVAQKRGNKFNVIPEAEVAKMKAAAAPVIGQWVADVSKKGIDGKAMLAEARRLIDKYTRMGMK
jgi:TRAP-type C4-dicarboxylate transport system substrate-binding protein